MALLHTLSRYSPLAFAFGLLRRQRPIGQLVTFTFALICSLWLLYHSLGPRFSRVPSGIPEVPQHIPDIPSQPGLPTRPKPPPVSDTKAWAKKAESVKKAFIHAYHGYEAYGLPHDELQPITDGWSDRFNGWGVTAVDSLSTMKLMGLEGETQRTIDFIKKMTFPTGKAVSIPFFETVIRYLGGLLSGYALTKEPVLLEKAEKLGSMLSGAFNTSSGLPATSAYLSPSGSNYGFAYGPLAEIASCQLEFAYLGHATGKKEYYDMATGVNKALKNASLASTGGMLPTNWDLVTGEPYQEHLSVGGQADSGHEYLLKYYLLTARTDKDMLKMYLRTALHIMTTMMYVSPTRGILYTTDISGWSSASHKAEHLSCFLPGLFALAYHTLPLDNLQSLGISNNDIIIGTTESSRLKRQILSEYSIQSLHRWAAEGLTDGCYMSYADMSTGIGPEMVYMQSKVNDTPASLWVNALAAWKKSGARGSPPGLTPKKPVIWSKGEGERDYFVGVHYYILRPETLESMYLTWRITGDERWRHRAWDIFLALEKHTKTTHGYANIQNVDNLPAEKLNSMPSYFLAETLKYLYLLFSDPELLSLDKWVLNTEAHPLPVFTPKW